MGLAWFGNLDYCDERPPLHAPEDYVCSKCGKEWVWRRAYGYNGPLPKCKDCGGELRKVPPNVEFSGEGKRSLTDSAGT